MKQIKFKITGTTPAMFNNPSTVNPFNPIAREIKAITGLRKKTEEDMLTLFKLKFLASCYYDEQKGYYIPASHFAKAIESAGKEMKLGKKIVQSTIVPMDSNLKFKHDNLKPESLYESEKQYVDIRDCGIMKARVATARMIVPEWSTTLVVMYDETQIDRSDLIKSVEIAGLRYGIGTFRAQFGKFTAEVCK